MLFSLNGFGAGDCMPLPCKKLCGHDLKRFHVTCLVCRFRRAYVGKYRARYLDHARVECRMIYDKRGYYIVPRKGYCYVLTVDGDRKNRRIKDVLLKRVLSVAEILAN
jgi:hypothetical protein